MPTHAAMMMSAISAASVTEYRPGAAPSARSALLGRRRSGTRGGRHQHFQALAQSRGVVGCCGPFTEIPVGKCQAARATTRRLTPQHPTGESRVCTTDRSR